MLLALRNTDCTVYFSCDMLHIVVQALVSEGALRQPGCDVMSELS